MLFKKKNGADLKVVVSPFFFFKTVVRKMPLLLRHDDYALRLDIFFGETFLMLLPLRCCCRMRPSWKNYHCIQPSKKGVNFIQTWKIRDRRACLVDIPPRLEAMHFLLFIARNPDDDKPFPEKFRCFFNHLLTFFNMNANQLNAICPLFMIFAPTSTPPSSSTWRRLSTLEILRHCGLIRAFMEKVLTPR